VTPRVEKIIGKGEPGKYLSERVCAIIVTYNCGGKVLPTARSVIPQVDRVLFVDNGSLDSTGKVLEMIRDEAPGSVEIVTLGENRGIASALNVGVRRALELGYTWVLTMDHDSEADGRMVENLVRAVHEHREPEKVVVSAPVYIDRGTKEAGRIYRYEGWRRQRLDPISPGGIATPTVVITSGNLLNVGHCMALGGFDESLFIDYVDYDFCLRAGIAGFHIIVCADALLSHSVGEAVSRKFLGFKIFSTNHSPDRRYTIGRNRMTVIRRYSSDFPAYAFYTALDFLYEFLGITFCEDRKLIKLRMILRGALSSWNPRATSRPTLVTPKTGSIHYKP
jgi:rhamnosyltransferase